MHLLIAREADVMGGWGKLRNADVHNSCWLDAITMIRENEVDRHVAPMWIDEKCVQSFFRRKLMERENLQDLDVNGRIILECISKEFL